jgi:hypothetical protein
VVLQDFEKAQDGVDADQEQHPHVEHHDRIQNLDKIRCPPFAERLANRATLDHLPHLLDSAQLRRQDWDLGGSSAINQVGLGSSTLKRYPVLVPDIFWSFSWEGVSKR